jgi:zinc/manganese transport system substrate-binding protein
MKPIIVTGLLVLVTAMNAIGVPLQVCALHPLMADLARQVGGERVKVFDLVGEGGNPHRFEPRPADLETMQASALVVAAGKNLEPYLGRIKDSMQGVTVVEVGSTLPSLTVDKDGENGCCPQHAAGAVDPHWWHGVENMRRAARVVALAMAQRDPAGRAIYLNNASTYSQRLDQLKRWARSELGKVPSGQRKLVTAHNAFAYFAKEFGFEVLAVGGLNHEQNNSPKDLAKTIEEVKNAGVKAIFPETNANTKILQSIATATATSLGAPLIADGNGSGKDAGFEAMIRHNVESITRALAPP